MDMPRIPLAWHLKMNLPLFVLHVCSYRCESVAIYCMSEYNIYCLAKYLMNPANFHVRLVAFFTRKTFLTSLPSCVKLEVNAIDKIPLILSL